MSGSLVLMTSVGARLFFCWLGLSNFDVMVFILSFIIITFIM